MTYTSNVPQAQQKISDTQNPILGNFTDLQPYLNVNHVDINFGTVDAGRHIGVALYPQPSSPPASMFTGGLSNVGFYSFLNPTTAVNEIYVNKANATQVPMTAGSLVANQGWSYLPSGLILKWGTSSFNGSGGATVSLVFGPVFAAIFVPFTTYVAATSGARAITVSPISTTQLSCFGEASQSFYFIALGR